MRPQNLFGGSTANNFQRVNHEMTARLLAQDFIVSTLLASIARPV